MRVSYLLPSASGGLGWAVATALMAKMKIAPRDRPKAKAELLRVLASHKLDPARTRLLGLFIDQYLVMTANEMKQFERELAGFAPAESENVMELRTSWELIGEERGMERGLHEGMERMALRQIRKRFGAVSSDVSARLAQLSSEQLDDLGEALFDFTNITDLEQWLARSCAREKNPLPASPLAARGGVFPGM